MIIIHPNPKQQLWKNTIKLVFWISIFLEKQISMAYVHIRKVFYGWLQFQELGHWTTSAIHSNTLEKKRGIQLLWQNYSIWDRSFIVVQGDRRKQHPTDREIRFEKKNQELLFSTRCRKTCFLLHSRGKITFLVKVSVL